jgi:hypothetical protein
MERRVERLRDPLVGRFPGLLADSERSGVSLLRRLVDAWRSGHNRFDRPGEALLGAPDGETRR